MTEREIFEKYANLIEDELSKKSNKTKLSQQKWTKATIFCAQKLLKRGKFVILCFLKNWNCPDNLIYSTTIDKLFYQKEMFRNKNQLHNCLAAPRPKSNSCTNDLVHKSWIPIILISFALEPATIITKLDSLIPRRTLAPLNWYGRSNIEPKFPVTRLAKRP